MRVQGLGLGFEKCRAVQDHGSSGFDVGSWTSNLSLGRVRSTGQGTGVWGYGRLGLCACHTSSLNTKA